MRDPKRIERILKLVKVVWKAHPDWRCGQLLSNLSNTDVYYLEDHVFERTLNEWIYDQNIRYRGVK